jgi:hypothetical protein
MNILTIHFTISGQKISKNGTDILLNLRLYIKAVAVNYVSVYNQTNTNVINYIIISNIYLPFQLYSIDVFCTEVSFLSPVKMSQRKGTSKFFLLVNVEKNSDSGSRLDLRVGIVLSILAFVMYLYGFLKL